jgi:hypothetical protein
VVLFGVDFNFARAKKNIWVIFTSFSYISHMFFFLQVILISYSLATHETVIVVSICLCNFLSFGVIFIHLDYTVKWFYLVLILILQELKEDEMREKKGIPNILE